MTSHLSLGNKGEMFERKKTTAKNATVYWMNHQAQREGLNSKHPIVSILPNGH